MKLSLIFHFANLIPILHHVQKEVAHIFQKHDSIA